MLQSSKLLCGLACVLLVASNIWTMRHWSERRGVADDLCYLRQAHLFQKSGWRGLDTDIASDTDGYFKSLVIEAGHPEWDQADNSICHIRMAATDKRVIQYPPGPGFLLALFPEGFQVVPLYAIATVLILLMARVAIACATSPRALAASTAFGLTALYFMINPAKASYSIPPTMVICAAVGYLTAKLFQLRRSRAQWLVTGLIGFLLGLSVTFRIPNVLLCAGYAGFFLITFVSERTPGSFLRGALFGTAVLVGLAPTLIANAINAGSPFATTYGGQDVSPPDFTFGITGAYLKDLQGLLIVAAIGWVAAILVKRRTPLMLPVAVVTAINLAVNLGYFLSHPVFTQYYLMPLAMLSLWSLLFSYVLDDREGVEAATAAQPAAQTQA